MKVIITKKGNVFKIYSDEKVWKSVISDLFSFLIIVGIIYVNNVVFPHRFVFDVLAVAFILLWFSSKVGDNELVVSKEELKNAIDNWDTKINLHEYIRKEKWKK